MTSKKNLINIFNDKLYNYKNKTYLSFVQKNLKQYKKKNIQDIKIEYLDSYMNTGFYNEIFMINEKGLIEFFHEENLIKFNSSKKRFSMNNLLNINIKNQRTYEVIKVLEILQKKFFISNNLKDLVHIKYEDILSEHGKIFDVYLSKSIISNILNNVYYRDKKNKIYPLIYLTPKKSFLIYIRIKCLLGKSAFASDKELKTMLYEKFEIKIGVVQISQIRKKYFILKKSKRKKGVPYLRFNEFFSPKLELKKTIIKHFQNIQAIYELSIVSNVDYSYNRSNVIYIGSSKNIYKRFIEYVNDNAHTLRMRDFFKNNNVFFRYIETENYLELEKTLLNEFIELNGSLPLLNKNNLTKLSRFDLDNKQLCLE